MITETIYCYYKKDRTIAYLTKKETTFIEETQWSPTMYGNFFERIAAIVIKY